MITFEWDARKAESNQRKRGVSFEEARSVFYDEFAIQFFDDEHSSQEDRSTTLDYTIVNDEFAIQFFDEEHSSQEDRFIMLGMSALGRILIVCHCERGRNTIRIISARKATQAERAYYTRDEP